MKILLLPLLITTLPIGILGLMLKFLLKGKKLSILKKIGLILLFAAFQLLASICAMFVSISGITDDGNKCATGAASFLFFGLIAMIGILVIVVLYKEKPVSSKLYGWFNFLCLGNVFWFLYFYFWNFNKLSYLCRPKNRSDQFSSLKVDHRLQVGMFQSESFLNNFL